MSELVERYFAATAEARKSVSWEHRFRLSYLHILNP
jgi:hypothetical protein